MIKIYDKSRNDRVYIASLHFNFAKAVVEASLIRTRLAEDLVSSVRELLTSEYRKCVYIPVFNSTIKSYAVDFNRKNKDWMISFINNILPDKLICYPILLQNIKKIDKNLNSEIIGKLDLDGIAEKESSSRVEQFSAIGRLLNALGDRGDELLNKLDLTELSKEANKAKIEKLQLIGDLLNALGRRRDELLSKLDLAELSKEANKAKIEHFEQIQTLLDALGGRRNELLKKLDLAELSKEANKANVAHLQQISELLNALGDRGDELLNKLDLTELSKEANKAKVEQFIQVTKLLNSLGARRDELLNKLDLAELSKEANKAKIEQFEQINTLLNALENRRNELIENLDFTMLAKVAETAGIERFELIRNLLNTLGNQKELFIDKLIAQDILKKLGETISDAPTNRFQDIANLLNELGPRKINLIALLNLDKLIKKVNETSLVDIRGLTLLMARLDETSRDIFIRRVDWASLILKCPIKAGLFRAMGGCLENLYKQPIMLSDNRDFDKVTQYLRGHKNEIIHEIKNAYLTVRKQFNSHNSLYAGVGKFFWHYNQIDHTMALGIATDTMNKLTENFQITPTNYNYASQLINAIYEISPDLSRSFLESYTVRGRIQQSINEDDWSKEITNLRNLVEVFYRSSPDMWRRMVNYGRIIVDLSSLDLESIYIKIDEEKMLHSAITKQRLLHTDEI